MKRCKNPIQIYQSNEFSQRVCSTLSIYQYRFLYLLISHVRPTDTEFCTEYYTFNELSEILELAHGGKQIKQLTNSLLEIGKQAWWLYDGKDTVEMMSWFSLCRVQLSTGDVTVRLNESLLPHLTQLKKCFTVFDFNTLLQFRSKYADRLYILCKSWQSKNTFVMEFSKLRKILNADMEIYNQFYNFKQKVLDIAVTEINADSDVFVSYQADYFHAKTVSSVTFTVQSKATDMIMTKNTSQ